MRSLCAVRGCEEPLPPGRRKYCTDGCSERGRKAAQRAIDRNDEETEIVEVVLTVWRHHPVATSAMVRDLFWQDKNRFQQMGYGALGRKHGPVGKREREIE